jgi:hypothetical protein
MPNHYGERWDGPIRGLQLPLTAWNSLQEDGIRTMDQLRQLRTSSNASPGLG